MNEGDCLITIRYGNKQYFINRFDLIGKPKELIKLYDATGRKIGTIIRKDAIESLDKINGYELSY